MAKELELAKKLAVLGWILRSKLITEEEYRRTKIKAVVNKCYCSVLYKTKLHYRKGVDDVEDKLVEVIKKSDGLVIRNRRLKNKSHTITRKRVAAYVRVSTNAEEQLQSFKSQKEYYQDKMSENKEWSPVGIYAEM